MEIHDLLEFTAMNIDASIRTAHNNRKIVQTYCFFLSVLVNILQRLAAPLANAMTFVASAEIPKSRLTFRIHIYKCQVSLAAFHSFASRVLEKDD